jgi:hypothetical protein
MKTPSLQTLANASEDQAWVEIDKEITKWLHEVLHGNKYTREDARNAALATINDYVQGNQKRSLAIRSRVDRRLQGEYYLY